MAGRQRGSLRRSQPTVAESVPEMHARSPARSPASLGISPFLYFAGTPRAGDPLDAHFHAAPEDMFEGFAHMSIAPDEVAVADFALEPHRIAYQSWLDS